MIAKMDSPNGNGPFKSVAKSLQFWHGLVVGVNG